MRALLLAAALAAAPLPGRAAPSTPPPATAPVPALAEPDREEPAAVPPEVKEQLRAFTDGKGHWILAVPYGGSETPVFAGDGTRFWRARVHGTFRHRAEKQWSRSFWDPRSPPGRMAPTFEGEEPFLWCSGEKLAYRAAAEEESRSLVSKALLLEPRWRRYPHVFARDDEGTYFLVEGLRKTDGDPAGADHRLWVGPRKKMTRVVISRVQEDGTGLLVFSEAGKLETKRDKDGQWTAEWTGPAAAPRKLIWLDAAGPSSVVLYRETSVWGGRPLGTPCDPFFAAP